MSGKSTCLWAAIALLLIISLPATASVNPIDNPSFESDFVSWTMYSYGSGQVTPTKPAAGATGPGSTFELLFDYPEATDGVQVCGLQGWYDAKCGGVYQAFTASTAGSIRIAARAFSGVVDSSYHEKDMGVKVRAAVVRGMASDRSAVLTSGSAWVTCAWGANWNDIVIPIAASGPYTLFIENSLSFDNCIYSTTWDNVRFQAVPEPNAFLTLLAGVAGVGTAALRRKK